MPKKPKTPHPWLSWSQVDLWHKCGMMYQARYLLKKKAKRNYNMRLGSANHAAAHKINQLAMKGIELAPDDARVLARAAVKQEMLSAEIKPWDWADMVEGLIAWSREAFFRRKDMYGGEIECRVPYSVDASVEMMAKVDVAFYLPDGGMEIIDFKNSRKISKKDDIRDDRQVAVYCWVMLERVPGLKYIRAGHWYFRHQSYNLVDVDPALVGHVKEWIDQALEGVVSKKFPARINSECGRCELRGSCKEYAARYKGIKGGRPKDALDAHRKYDKIHRTIKLLEAEKEALRSYLGDQADKQDQILVDSGSQAWYHRVENPRTVPARPTVKLYSEHGVELLDHLTVKTTELDKATKVVLKSLPSKLAQDEFLKKLAKVEVREKRTKLVLGKPLPQKKAAKKGVK